MAISLRTQLDAVPDESAQRQRQEQKQQPERQRQQQQQPDQQQQPPLRAAPHPAATSEQEREAERVLLDMQQHVARHGPADSFFPASCQWREVGPRPTSGACDPRNVKQRGALFGGLESVWSCHRYEYLSNASKEWTQEQPAECRLQTVPLVTWARDRAALQVGNSSVAWGSSSTMSTWGLEQWLSQQKQEQQEKQHHKRQEQEAAEAGSHAHIGGTGRQPCTLSSTDVASDVRCTGSHCLFRNLWYSGGHFYFLQDTRSPTHLPPRQWQLGRNRRSSVLSVRSAPAFAASVPAARVATGETVVLDYNFFLHPKALGHWLEQLLPLFRWVADPGWDQQLDAPVCCHRLYAMHRRHASTVKLRPASPALPMCPCSMLQHEPLVRRTPDRVLLLFQQRANLCGWLRGLLAAVLGTMPGQGLPPLLFQQVSPLECLSGCVCLPIGACLHESLPA